MDLRKTYGHCFWDHISALHKDTAQQEGKISSMEAQDLESLHLTPHGEIPNNIVQQERDVFLHDQNAFNELE